MDKTSCRICQSRPVCTTYADLKKVLRKHLWKDPMGYGSAWVGLSAMLGMWCEHYIQQEEDQRA